MKVRQFEGFMKGLIEGSGHDEINKVQTFAEAGLTDKPVGLKIEFTDGACVYVQFVRTSPPGGDQPDHADYKIPESRL